MYRFQSLGQYLAHKRRITRIEWSLLILAFLAFGLMLVGCGDSPTAPVLESVALAKGGVPNIALVGELTSISPDTWAKYVHLAEIYRLSAQFIHYPRPGADSAREWWTAMAGVVAEDWCGQFLAFGDSIVSIMHLDGLGLDTLIYRRIVNVGYSLCDLRPRTADTRVFSYRMQHPNTLKRLSDNKSLFESLGYTVADVPGFVIWDGKKAVWLAPVTPMEILLATINNW